VATDTSKRSAAAQRDKPPSTAAITCDRKSSDNALVIQAGLQTSPQADQIRPASGKLSLG
jgi:hypothetical protein